MYDLIYNHEHTPYIQNNMDALGIDQYFALQGWELLLESANNMFDFETEAEQKNRIKEEEYMYSLDTEEMQTYTEPYWEHKKLVSQYSDSVISLVIGCVQEIGQAQINLTSLSISSTIDPEMKNSITITPSKI